MRKSHEILLRCFHDPAFSFRDVTVCYIDRGAPGNESCVTGEQIVTLDSRFLEIGESSRSSPIPYHRITRIMYQGNVLWERGVKGSER